MSIPDDCERPREDRVRIPSTCAYSWLCPCTPVLPVLGLTVAQRVNSPAIKPDNPIQSLGSI